MTEAPNETFRKVHINGDKNNLPKKAGLYIVQIKSWGSDQAMFGHDPDVIKEWLEEVDWYLQPVEQSNPEGKEESRLHKIFEMVKEANTPDNHTFEFRDAEYRMNNFMQVRDLTDEEWLALPKEEILQLYKNCYKMLIIPVVR